MKTDQTVIVTGGAGFIGSNFIHTFIDTALGIVVNIDKLTYAGNLENLDALVDNPRHIFVKGDICDSALIASLLNRHQPVAVVNFAAESHVDRSIIDPDAFVQTNVVGTFNLLNQTYHHWCGLPHERQIAFRFLQVSTDEVYGALGPDDDAFCETAPYAPNSPYSASKAAADHLVRAYHRTYGLPTVITNCSNNYGPYQFPEKLIPLVIHNALKGKSIPVYGDGLNVRDWLYVADHCQAVIKVLETATPGDAYNIGGNNQKTNLEVVKKICAILDEINPRAEGRSYADQISFVNDRPGHDRRYAIDASKIRDSLDWEPTNDFETGLRKTIQWYLDNQGWVENVTSGAYQNWIETNYGMRS